MTVLEQLLAIKERLERTTTDPKWLNDQIDKVIADMQTTATDGNVVAIKEKTAVVAGHAKAEMKQAALAAFPAFLGRVALVGDDVKDQEEIERVCRMSIYAGLQMQKHLAQVRINMSEDQTS